MQLVRAPGAVEEAHTVVLLCEPQLLHAYSITDALVRSRDVFVMQHADSMEAVLHCLTARPIDVGLIDVGVLGESVAAAMLRLVSHSPGTSFVILCDEHEQGEAMAAVRSGAHDYLVRNTISPSALYQRVRTAVGRNDAQSNLHFLAHHDTLTKLANRVFFTRCLDAAIDATAPPSEFIGLLFIDLDGFKPINDTYGHDAGDEVLRVVAHRLQAVLTRSEVVARLGGDEFAILLEDLSNEADALTLAQQILGEVSRPIRLRQKVTAQISCSVGVVTTHRDISAEELLKHADSAMYRAKRAGGGAIRIASPIAEDIDKVLSSALSRDEFELYYQPQVRGADGVLIGVEALLRWNRDAEVIAPARFVSDLEETGLIVSVGEWVLCTALQQLVAWSRRGIEVPRVAVNVSPLQLVRAGFADRVERMLCEVGVLPSQLEIEITERTVLVNDTTTQANLEALRRMGVLLAIDDFGTGYTSLSYLHQNLVDTLKIDRRFVHDLDSNPRSHSIVGSILDLGRRLKVRVVAEGVERPRQVELLRSERCDVLQGYLFGRPQAGTVDPRATSTMA